MIPPIFHNTNANTPNNGADKVKFEFQVGSSILNNVAVTGLTIIDRMVYGGEIYGVLQPTAI